MAIRDTVALGPDTCDLCGHHRDESVSACPQHRLWKAEAENELLRKFCYASLHLLKGSDLIYDTRNDTGPTNWRETRDRLIAELERVV